MDALDLTEKERRLLLVDDDPHLLRSLRRVFELKGWHVYPATGVHDAMRVLARFHPQVALVDVCMPDGGALGFFAQSNAQNLQIPTVLMSGSDHVRKLVEEKLQGSVRFIDKPLDVDVAQLELKKALAAPNPRDVARQQRQVELEKRVNDILTFGAKMSNELPVLDPTLAAALPIFQQESTRTDAVVRIVGRDAATAAAVIRTANSGYFKGARAIETLEDACVRVGMQGIAEVVHQVAVIRAFEITNPRLSIFGKRAFENAAATATLSRAIAKALPQLQVNPGEAYLVGLLHNVGEVAALFLLDRRLTNEDKRKLTLEMIAPGIRAHHEATGASVFSKWGLPQTLVAVASNHHADVNLAASPSRRILKVAWEIASRSRFEYQFGPDLGRLDLRDPKDAPDEEAFTSIQTSLSALQPYARLLDLSAERLRAIASAALSV